MGEVERVWRNFRSEDKTAELQLRVQAKPSRRLGVAAEGVLLQQVLKHARC